MFTKIFNFQLFTFVIVTSSSAFAISGIFDDDEPTSPQHFESQTMEERLGILPGTPVDPDYVYTPGNPTVHSDAYNGPVRRNTSQVHALLVLADNGASVEQYMKDFVNDYAADSEGHPFRMYDLKIYEKRAVNERGSASRAVDLLWLDIFNDMRTSKSHMHFAIELPSDLKAEDSLIQLTQLQEVLAAAKIQVGKEVFSLRNTDFFLIARNTQNLNLAALSQQRDLNTIHKHLYQHGYPEQLLNSVAGYSTYFKSDCIADMEQEAQKAPKK